MPGLFASLTESAVQEFTLVGPDDDAVSADWDGSIIDTGVFNEILQPVGEEAKVLAVYTDSYYKGLPALIEHKVGKGRVLHFGGVFSRENLVKFFQYTGIFEPYENLIQAPAECEIAIRKKEEQQYLFVLNFAKEEKEICLNQKMVDMDTKAFVQGTVILPPYGTKVYQM